MGEGLLLELSWVDGSVSIVLPRERSSCLFNSPLFVHHVEVNVFIL